jgi:hypothetical protein
MYAVSATELLNETQLTHIDDAIDVFSVNDCDKEYYEATPVIEWS